MNAPSIPPDPQRPSAPNAPSEGEPYVPLYVQMPLDPRESAGKRNLVWGVLLLLAAALLAGVSLIIAGPRALLWPAGLLAGGTALWVLARLEVLSQRNGSFVGLGVLMLLGVLLPLVETGYTALDTYVKGGHPPAAAPAPLAPSPSIVSATPAPQVAVLPTAAPRKVVASTGPQPLNVGSRPGSNAAIRTTPVQSRAPEPAPAVGKGSPAAVLAMESSKPAAPSENSDLPQPSVLDDGDQVGTRATMVRDVTVTLDGRSFLFKKGESFPVLQFLPSEIVLAAGDLKAPIKREDVQVEENNTPVNTPVASMEDETPLSEAERKEVVRRAQDEAIKRYPNLAVEGTPEHSLFMAEYTNLTDSGSGLFDDAQWPLLLAEFLADKHGWEKK